MNHKKYSITALVILALGFIYYTRIAYMGVFSRNIEFNSGGGYNVVDSPLTTECIPIIVVYIAIIVSLLFLVFSVSTRKKSMLIFTSILLIITTIGMFFTDTESAEFIFIRFDLGVNLIDIIPYKIVKFIPIVLALVFEIVALFNIRTIPSYTNSN